MPSLLDTAGFGSSRPWAVTGCWLFVVLIAHKTVEMLSTTIINPSRGSALKRALDIKLSTRTASEMLDRLQKFAKDLRGSINIGSVDINGETIPTVLIPAADNDFWTSSLDDLENSTENFL